MTGLAEWLLDQISDDEKSTEHALWSEPDPWRLGNYCEYGHITIDPRRVLAECAAKRKIVALHTPCVSYPVGILADDGTVTDVPEGSFEAIVRTRRGCPVCAPIYSLAPCDTLVLLAAPYSDRPGFREEWRV